MSCNRVIAMPVSGNRRIGTAAFTSSVPVSYGLSVRSFVGNCNRRRIGKIPSNVTVPAPVRTTTPCMVFDRIKDIADSVLKNIGQGTSLSSKSPTSAATIMNEKSKLPASRSVVLVTGATGKTGGAIMRELLSTGAATKIVAQISPRNDGVPFDWDSNIVSTVSADLSTADGVDSVARAALDAGVGSVIYAASGGPQTCRPVDSEAVSRLASVLSSKFESDTTALFEFPRDHAAFAPLDDVVMGGRSSSTMSSGGVFGGEVTTAGGGGFAQTKALLSASKFAAGSETVDLSKFDGIQLRVKGDGQTRTYKLNLKDDDIPDFAYQAVFMVSGTGWSTIRVPFSDLVPMKRGKVQYADASTGGGNGIYARSIDLTRVRTLGIVLSLVANGIARVADVREREGEFALELNSIRAYRAEGPRFVLLSSAAVTRPFWNASERKSKGEAMTEIPIVKLNPGQILTHKLAGENALRSSGISYTVIRPIGLNDEAPTGRMIRLAQGDVISGRINRADVARATAAILGNAEATMKTFELGAVLDLQAPMDDSDIGTDALKKLSSDAIEEAYAEALKEALANPPAPVAAA